MPIHDWTRVDAGIFHDFHLSWIAEIKRSLNTGVLPAGYYALAEQIAGGFEPDVLTLQGPVEAPSRAATAEAEPAGGIAVAEAPPAVDFHARLEIDVYAARARRIVIRHRSRHQVIAIIEIVSPGNKDSKGAFAAFVEKAHRVLLSGVNLLIVDLFPPTNRDPQGIHQAIWDWETDGRFPLPETKPLTCVSYVGYPNLQVYLTPVAVGETLPDMPLFLSPRAYVPVALEATYQSAWESVPDFWRDRITGSPPSGPEKPENGRTREP
ncbi:MAG: DUF4058 family protein [Isosphaeraceae bacterium]